jgi:hypothetical protein
MQNGSTLTVLCLGLPDIKVGTFTQALYDEAKEKGWIVISMKNDWKRILPSRTDCNTALVLYCLPEKAMERYRIRR